MLAAAGMNLKRMINKWKVNPLVFLAHLFEAIFRTYKNQNLPKMSF
jgi:hypothetical protein